MLAEVFIVVMVIPLSVAKNGLRIFVITMLSTRVDFGYLTGRLHRQGGIFFVIMALIAMFGILEWLRRGEKQKQLIQPKPMRDTMAIR